MFLHTLWARLASPTIPRNALTAVALGAMAVAMPASAADSLVAVSSGGFAEAFKTLAQDYSSRPSALPVDAQFGPSMGKTPQAIPARLARGESIDVVIMVGSALDQLIADGIADGSTKVVLADSYIACAVPAGAPPARSQHTRRGARRLLERPQRRLVRQRQWRVHPA